MNVDAHAALSPIIKENDVNRVFFVKKNIIILNGLDK